MNLYLLFPVLAAVGFVAGAAAEFQRIVPRTQGASEGFKQLMFGMFRSRRAEYTVAGWLLVLTQRSAFLLLMLLISYIFISSVVSGH